MIYNRYKALSEKARQKLVKKLLQLDLDGEFPHATGREVANYAERTLQKEFDLDEEYVLKYDDWCMIRADLIDVREGRPIPRDPMHGNKRYEEFDVTDHGRLNAMLSSGAFVG